MSHCCLLVEGKVLLDVYKAYSYYDTPYLFEIFKKQRDDYHTRNSNALVQHKCNSTMYGLIVVQTFLNGMEDKGCGYNTCNCIYVYVARLLFFWNPMRLHRIFPFHIHCIVVHNCSFR